MSRYNTQVLSSIRMLCRMQNIDEKVLYERAKLILSIYREVCWSTIDRANDVCDTLICTYGDSLDGALIYLENFAPDEARERFEERIRSLFETKWIIERNRQISRRIKKHLWLSNRSWARDVHSFGILHSWGALAGKSCSAQASSIWLIAGAFRRTQSK